MVSKTTLATMILIGITIFEKIQTLPISDEIFKQTSKYSEHRAKRVIVFVKSNIRSLI
jgi:hypothetical protein